MQVKVTQSFLSPTRLLCPWYSPGKNTGVGCHFLLQCMKVKSESEVSQSCPTLSDLMEEPTRLLRSWDFPGKSTGVGSKNWGFLAAAGGASGKEPSCQFRRHKRRGFDPWVGKIPWKRAWQPTPVFLPGESCGQKPGGQVHGVAQSQTQLKGFSTLHTVHKAVSYH